MKTKVSMPIIIAAVLFLVVIVGLIARANFGPSSAPPLNASPEQQASNAWLTQKAKECSGSFDKLDPSDQQKAQDLTKGKGAFVISMIYNNTK